MRDPIETVERETMLLARRAAFRSAVPKGLVRLERSAYALLTRIESEGTMSAGELQEAFGLDQSTIHRQTTAMTKSGLVERTLDPAGGVARRLRITAEGAQRLATHRSSVIAGLRRVLSDWTDEELITLGENLQRLNEAVERDEGRSWPRA